MCCINLFFYSGYINTGPLTDSHEIKGFFIKAILGKLKVVLLNSNKNKEQINIKFSSIFIGPWSFKSMYDR